MAALHSRGRADLNATLPCIVLLAVAAATGCRSDGDTTTNMAQSTDRGARADAFPSSDAAAPPTDLSTTPGDARVRLDVARPASDARTGPGLDGGLASEDAASEPRDARLARDGASLELEAQWRAIAVRFCEEDCRCGQIDGSPVCRGYIRGCALSYGFTADGCVEDFMQAMRYLSHCCADEDCPSRTCTCQWLAECEQHYSTEQCDPDIYRSIEVLPQCTAAGGAPIDGDPTCPQGPITTCDAGVP